VTDSLQLLGPDVGVEKESPGGKSFGMLFLGPKSPKGPFPAEGLSVKNGQRRQIQENHVIFKNNGMIINVILNIFIKD